MLSPYEYDMLSAQNGDSPDGVLELNPVVIFYIGSNTDMLSENICYRQNIYADTKRYSKGTGAWRMNCTLNRCQSWGGQTGHAILVRFSRRIAPELRPESGQNRVRIVHSDPY